MEEKIDKTNDRPSQTQDHQGLPSTPKGIGISPKIFLMFTGIFLVVIFLVVVMIFSYRGQKDDIKPQQQNTLVEQQSGVSPETAISALNKENSDGVLISGRSEANNPSVMDHKETETVSQDSLTPEQTQEAIEAAKSPISVINNFNNQQPSQTQDSADQMSNLNNEANRLNDLAENALNNLPAMGGRGEGYQQQNMQSQKTAFLKASKGDNKFYMDSTLQKPASLYEIKSGTLIPAILLTGINSDLPGHITAQVSRNVYDTVSGNYLLIPQGTKILGVYDSQVAYGQNRVLIAWSRLIFPNGDSFDLQGQPGVDLAGMSGLHDLTDNHYMRVFGSALAFSVFGALGQLSQPKQAANGFPSNSQIIYGAVGQNLTQTGIQMTEKNMNIQPTNKIRQGADFSVLITRDMVFPGSYH